MNITKVHLHSDDLKYLEVGSLLVPLFDLKLKNLSIKKDEAIVFLGYKLNSNFVYIDIFAQNKIATFWTTSHSFSKIFWYVSNCE